MRNGATVLQQVLSSLPHSFRVEVSIVTLVMIYLLAWRNVFSLFVQGCRIMNTLDGRVKCAIITGAGSGIGRSTLQKFSREGWRCFATDIKNDGLHEYFQEISGHSGRIAMLVGDLTDNAFRTRLIEESLKFFKALPKFDDLSFLSLINCAGIVKDSPFGGVKESTIESTFAVNCFAPFLLCQQFFMKYARRITSSDPSSWKGSIVNVCSISHHLNLVGQSAYVGSKAALEAMTRQMAAESTSQGLTANCVSPGFVKTPMTEKLPVEYVSGNRSLNGVISKNGKL